MTTSLINLPAPDKAKNPKQKSIDVNDLFLTRFMPPWSRPASLSAYTWRQWVLNQPVAITCRETLIASTLALDWKITPVNSNYREELDGTIKYYTKLFTQGGNYAGLMLDYSGLIEWIAADILDTPFGGAAEIGHKGGDRKGRVQWIRPLDAGTLYPTLNQEFPVIQYWQGWDAVVFKDHEISRTYMSPHTFIWREGWGMAPPEKVYFAMDLLGRGDKYYANLLLDIPTAGILDLGDMEKSAAEEWITAFKTFVNDNTTSFRVPVLYEHNNKVEFLPFGKVPNDIMFDRITLKYAAFVCAAYGMSLSDIGLQATASSGETLAGSIRQERRTRKTGFARLKKKLKSFFDNILPDTLEFNFIDYDDELNVALGKARLASATAFKMMQDAGQIAPQEARSQYIQDGLFSISIPDKLPPEAKPLPQPEPFGGSGFNKDKKEPELIGEKKAPSAGGEGEVKASFMVRSRSKNFDSVIRNLVEQVAPKLVDTLSSFSEDEVDLVRPTISASLFDDEDILGLQSVIDGVVGNRSLVNLKFSGLSEELKSIYGEDALIQPYVDEFEASIKKSLNGFLGRTTIYLLNDLLKDSDDLDLVNRSVIQALEKNLQDYITVHVGDEIQKMIESISLSN